MELRKEDILELRGQYTTFKMLKWSNIWPFYHEFY